MADEKSTTDSPAPDAASESASEAAKKTTAPKKTAEKKTESEDDFASGDVNLSDLRAGKENSDSIRRFQTALGVNVTGDFDAGTQRVYRAWQQSHGYVGGRGIKVSKEQAKGVLGNKYKIVTD